MRKWWLRSLVGRREENTRIRRAVPAECDVLLDVWLRSVRATHSFITEGEITLLIPEVRSYLASEDAEIWVLCEGCGTVMGFMGLCGNKVEALFLAPEFLRRGGACC
jgi:putative acetyltransferase